MRKDSTQICRNCRSRWIDQCIECGERKEDVNIAWLCMADWTKSFSMYFLIQSS